MQNGTRHGHDDKCKGVFGFIDQRCRAGDRHFLLALASTFGSDPLLLRSRTQTDGYGNYRTHIGKVLIVVIEPPASIIRMVALDQTLEDVAIPGLLLVIGTFSSWSLSFEIEEHWP